MARREKPFKAAYTVGDIETLYRSKMADGDELRLRTVAAELRKHCRLEQAVSIPGEYRAISREVRTPYLRDAWSRIAASLVAKPPVVQVEPKDEARREYRDAAADASRFLQAMMSRLNKEIGEDAVFSSTSALVRDGESVLKVVHRPDAWAAFPKLDSGLDASSVLKAQKEYKKGADLPIAWRNVDRLSTVWGDGEYGDDWCIEAGEYPLPVVRRQYGLEVDRNGRLYDPRNVLGGRPAPEGYGNGGTPGQVLKLEFWDRHEFHVVVDGIEPFGYPKRNPYAPHLPLFRAKANESEPLLYSLLYLVPTLDSLLTMQLNWAYLGAYPNPVVQSVATPQMMPGLDGGGDTGADELKVLWKPGKLIDLPIGKSLSFLSPPPVGQDLKDLTLVMRSLIEVAGVSSVMRGAEGSSDSGYQYNQMVSAAALQYRLASQALQRQSENALDFVLWMVPNLIRQPIFVQGWQEVNPKSGKPKTRAGKAWLGLAPDGDSDGRNIANCALLGPVSFTFRPTLPTDEQARAMVAVQLTNAARPLVSMRYAREKWLEVDDPDGLADEIAVEQALEEEPLKSTWRQRALEIAGLAPPAQDASQGQAAPPVDPNALMGGAAGMIPPGPGQLVPTIPGQVQGGLPSVPGLNMPIQPGGPAPQFPPGTGGGLPAGSYPGQPPIPPSNI